VNVLLQVSRVYLKIYIISLIISHVNRSDSDTYFATLQSANAFVSLLLTPISILRVLSRAHVMANVVNGKQANFYYYIIYIIL